MPFGRNRKCCNNACGGVSRVIALFRGSHPVVIVWRWGPPGGAAPATCWSGVVRVSEVIGGWVFCTPPSPRTSPRRVIYLTWSTIPRGSNVIDVSTFERMPSSVSSICCMYYTIRTHMLIVVK